MKRKDSIDALLLRSKKILEEIESFYDKNKKEKIISDDLKTNVMFCILCLHSVLHYLSREIIEMSDIKRTDKELRNLSFPIRSNTMDFRGFMSANYTRLDSISPELYKYLESIQPYQNTLNQWLSEFNKLANEHKHNDLVPQIKESIPVIDFGGPIVSGGFVSISKGAFVNGKIVKKSFVIEPNKKPPVEAKEYFENLTVYDWEEIIFETNSKPVLQSLIIVHSNIDKIYQKIKTLLV